MHAYEIKPTNFATLPDEKQLGALAKFYRLLASIQSPLRIVMQKQLIKVELGSENKNVLMPRTMLVAREPLEQTLEQVGLQYSIVTKEPTWKIVDEHLNYLVLADSVARCYSLYMMPSMLPAAWVHSLLLQCDLVSVYVKPIESHKAVSQMQRYLGLVSSGASMYSELKYRTEKASLVLDALTRQQSKMFSVCVTSLIKAQNLHSLKLADKKFRAASRTMMVSFDCGYAMQKTMLSWGIGKQLFFDLVSCGIFYPFVSSDMVEVPNGILLGLNVSTGSPVIYDYTQRENYNILLLASSGAGKSVTAKLILKRLKQKYPSAKIFVIDPNGEYEKIAPVLGLDVIKVSEQHGLGLDPFKLFDATDAADILADLKNVDEVIRTEFRAKAAGCHSIDEFYQIVNQKAQEYLADLVDGRISQVLKGQPKLSDSVVLSLKGTDGQDRVFLLLFLVLGKVWKMINSIENQIPKIILVDEGWMLFMKNTSGRFLNMIARMGRKFNVVFVFVTQRPEDVIENDFGRAIADNAATKIFLQNTEQAADKIKNAMSLSEQECDLIKTLQKGHCLLLTKDYRLYAQILPSKEELDLFSTDPTIPE